MLRLKAYPITKTKAKQDRLRKCSKCNREGLDRRRASEHKAKCWEKTGASWLFQSDAAGEYNLTADQVAGNNYNRKHGTTAIKRFCTGKHPTIG